MSKGHILFVSERKMPVEQKAMRVRGGKAGKVRTELSVLARGHNARFREGLEPDVIVSDSHLFGRFGEIPTKTGWETTQELVGVRHTISLTTFGIIKNNNIVEDSNRILRAVLNFKCITFDVIKKDLEAFPQRRQQKIDTTLVLLASNKDPKRKDSLRSLLAFWKTTKPFVQYAANTYVEIDKSKILEEYALHADLDRSIKLETGIIQRMQVGTIKVKNAFLNNGKRRVFFDNKSCELVKEMLMNLK